MTFCIALHSYKGGTGKTTIASNLSAHLAKQGNVVVLLDLDLYSPSLHTYFRITPKKWINDFLYSSANVKDIITDVSFTLYHGKDYEYDSYLNQSSKNDQVINLDSKGRLLLGLSHSNIDNFHQLDVSGIENQKHFFRKLVSFRDQIISKFNPDYIILDTSPGIRYWSLNTLAVSDIFLLTLKMGDIDIKGTEIMIKEIYSSFMHSGTKSFLLWNKVAGYCVPHSDFKTNPKMLSIDINDNASSTQIERMEFEEEQEIASKGMFDLNILVSIPCFCDIQFKKREYLTSFYYPSHPFSQRIESLAKKIYTELHHP